MSETIFDHLISMYDDVRQSVEAHFNKDQESKLYFVDDVTMTSRYRGIDSTRFIVKLHNTHEMLKRHKRYISCIVSCVRSWNGTFGGLRIENIYYSDDGQPVEGFTKEQQ